VIIGGGAAGLEAARRSAERGHEVVLFEKQPILGGSLIAAGANALKGDVKRYADWSVRTAQNTKGVTIKTNTEATRELIEAQSPDVVLIAAGSVPFVPKIPGIDGDNVVLATDIDLGTATAGERVVLIGAGLTGTETAVALAQSGHNVTLIDALDLPEIDSKGLSSMSVTAVLRYMSEAAGVLVMTGLTAKEITPGGVVASTREGAEINLPCDTVVLSMGVRPVTALMETLKGIDAQVLGIGDCTVRAGNITSAVRDGFYAAMNI
jgi:NADPH-dependent 2,4-dienoyl-CoA reductase/sulfur reductase-like enzyme